MAALPPFQGILFDLDRTLLDVRSITDYARALTDVRRLVGSWKDVTTPETSWNGPDRTCMAVLVALSGDRRWRRVSETIELHELAAVADSSPRPGAAEALDASGAWPCGVVTVLTERAARGALTRHGMAVDVVVARRPDLRPRPAPDQLLEAARVLGVPAPGLLLAGSSSWDVEAAEAAGAAVVVVGPEGRAELGHEVPVVPDLAALAEALRAAAPGGG